MTVYQHKNGRWYCRFQIRGKRYHESLPEATDKKSAENAEIKLKSELLSGRFDLIENKKERTFFQICDLFEEYAKNNRLNYDKDKGMVKKLKNFYGNKLLRDFTPQLVEKYRTKRVKENKKPATINKEIGILRRMFSLALDNNLVKFNPAVKKHIRPLNVENTLIRTLSIKEEKALIKACVDDLEYLKLVILFALHLGLRKSEILNLKWENIDLKKGQIAILIQKNRKKAFIPLSTTLKEELNKLQQNATTPYVIINPLTNKPYKNIRNNYNNVLEKANITNFTFHALRHTACTRLFELGVGIDVIKDVMRHSNISITLDVYNHISQGRKTDAINLLENYAKNITNIDKD